MHLLERGQAPKCLAKYRHGRDQWDVFHPDKDASEKAKREADEERASIHRELEAMQGRRCAYCECDLDIHGQHIEHFRQRSRHPQGTFDWENLFFSCLRKDSCGKHKDEQCKPYPPDDLIKPDIDDPEHYFLFVSDGTVALRPELNERERHRAQETLRIFNLDEKRDKKRGTLRFMRQAACIGYLQTAETIQDIAQEYPREEWLPFLDEELAKIANLPFCTAIKHTLTSA